MWKLNLTLAEVYNKTCEIFYILNHFNRNGLLLARNKLLDPVVLSLQHKQGFKHYDSIFTNTQAILKFFKYDLPGFQVK